MQPQDVPALEGQLLGRAACVGKASHGLHDTLQVWGEEMQVRWGGGGMDALARDPVGLSFPTLTLLLG